MLNINTKSEEILDIILQAINELVDYELAVILKVHDNNELCVQKAKGPLFTERLRGYSISLNKREDIAQLMKRSAPYLFADDEEHEDTYSEILDMPGGHSCLVSPLFLQEQPVGMLTLDHRACKKFSPGIVRFVASISKLISIILVQNDSSALLIEQQKILAEERNLLLSTNSVKFNKVKGNSSSWRRVLEAVKMVSGTDVSVLLQGETGTGKEEVAKLVHKLSHRSEKPFIALNCSAITPSLAESALFGHEKGAFTDAHSRRKGHFELADGGTLFLDEIGDLPLEIQPKLLRAIQEGTFKRIGGEVSINCDVRIIAATHIDIKEAIRKKTFREDLFYRICVFPIYLPPLRDREDDVLLLAQFFLDEINKSNSTVCSFDKSAVEFMLKFTWPGNVRELQNAVNRAYLVSGRQKINKEHFLFFSDSEEGQQLYSLEEGSEKIIPLEQAMAEYIKKALKKCDGKIYGKDGAAALLKIKPTTLQSRIKKLGIKNCWHDS